MSASASAFDYFSTALKISNCSDSRRRSLTRTPRDRRGLSFGRNFAVSFPVQRRVQILFARSRGFRLRKSFRCISRGSPSDHYKLLHSTNLKASSNEFSPNTHSESPFHPGDLYLCSESLAACAGLEKSSNSSMTNIQPTESLHSLQDLIHGQTSDSYSPYPSSQLSSRSGMLYIERFDSDEILPEEQESNHKNYTNPQEHTQSTIVGSDRNMLESCFSGESMNGSASRATNGIMNSGMVKVKTSPSGKSGLKDANLSGHASDGGVPVFVMLPLDTVSPQGELRNPRALAVGMQALRSAGVTGIMVDVWWGVVEREGPGIYDWSAYLEVLRLVKKAGLQMQAVMSFHECGGNVGDDVSISLPDWVHEAGQLDPDMFYTDKKGHRNRECISLFSDNSPCLWGRTPIQVYTDFMSAFREAMGDDFGTVVIEVAIGMGPCGELRYPAYPEGDGRWRFPGVGEFQCYDSRALADLRAAAHAVGQPAWGHGGPHDAGHYNATPHDTWFFSPHGSWSSSYGHFFLKWYSDALVKHGENMLRAAQLAFHSPRPPKTPSPTATNGDISDRTEETSAAVRPIKLSLKCAGIHWWYHSVSHGAELTAGYYNPRGRNGYSAIIDLCRRYGAEFNFTCMEMKNEEQPMEALCGPEELLNQVRVCAAQMGVTMNGENALARWDKDAYIQMNYNACSTSVTLNEIDEWGNTRKMEYQVPVMGAVTYLRLGPQLMNERNFGMFIAFVKSMRKSAETAHVPQHNHSQYMNHAYDFVSSHR